MENLTPAMQQFIKFKREHPNALLLFRMGDFYETFFDDAKEAAKILNIVLTKRGGKNPVPLAGIPYHALDTYLQKLVSAGKTVAIIEQVEDPKLAKGRIVKRDLVRIVTPGTIYEDNLLKSSLNNYIFAINKIDDKFGCAFADISTGEFKVFEANEADLINCLVKIKPAEIIYPDNLDIKIVDLIRRILNTTFTDQPFIYFSPQFGDEEIKSHFNIISLKTFEIENKNAVIGSVGALLNYFKYTQRTRLKHITKIQKYNHEEHMILDLQTLNNLEILESVEGNKKNTLLSILDYTSTPMGLRRLYKNLTLPLKEKEGIEKRLDIVEFIFKNNLFDSLRKNLELISDIERINTRVVYKTVTPKELIALKDSIAQAESLGKFIDEYKIPHLGFNVENKLLEVVGLIENSIVLDPPTQFKEGGFIKLGFNKELDELISLKKDSRKFLMEMEQREKEKTGIKSLKFGYNRVFGYFVEIPRHNSEVPPAYYVRKQTLANAERYTFEELKNLEDKIISAEEKSKNLELELYFQIIETIKESYEQILDLANKIADSDFFNSLTLSAFNNNYIKPEINNKKILEIKNGRHPVIEKILAENFVDNNLYMNSEKNNVIILTGPNMAGKSTYLRQNALIILMAHIGSFVPASKANINLTSRIFTRIGAKDNLALGLSTFMVEMVETANIINNADENSFIILDEVGRGTSTYDGLSIAWAVLEHIYNKIGAKVLFATHYHQITELEYKYSGIKNYYITAKEINNNLIFLRKVIEGTVDRSYGIAVAKLAGLPQDLIENAQNIEKQLESNSGEKKNIEKLTSKSLIKQKTLFGEE
jgi:DNA mismatch repair protein MutS